MTANQSNSGEAMTMTTMASFEDAYNDTDEDSRSSSPSLHSYGNDDDECDESLDAIIARYTCKRQQLTYEDYDDDNKRGDLDDEDSVSKPAVRIKLPVFEAPEFIQRLRGYNEATAGTSVSFVAQYKAFPAPTVKWFKDEEEVRATERHLLESSSSTHEGIIRLIINNVRPSDEGAYKCKVENQEGVASTTGYLSVIGDSRSRKIGRATSSRSNLVAPTLSPNRAAGVSTPPILRPIAEQKSMEESEERELARQPPSPLQAFIDSIRHSAKSRHPPIYYGTDNTFGRVDDDSGGSDGEDEVFDSEEDAASAATSSDSLEQLLIITPTSTGGDPDVYDNLTSINRQSFDSDRKPSTDEIASRSSCFENIELSSVVRIAQRSSEESAANVPVVRTSSSTSPSPLAATGLETDCHTSSSTFRQRRLGRLQMLHRLAIDLPDESLSVSVIPSVWDSSAETQLDSNVSHICNSDITASVDDAPCESAPVAVSHVATSCDADLRDTFRIAQDVVMATVDNSVAQFYISFVAIAVAFANFFDVQPSWLVLVVSLASFISFHVLRPRKSGVAAAV